MHMAKSAWQEGVCLKTGMGSERIWPEPFMADQSHEGGRRFVRVRQRLFLWTAIREATRVQNAPTARTASQESGP